jgi:transposase
LAGLYGFWKTSLLKLINCQLAEKKNLKVEKASAAVVDATIIQIVAANNVKLKANWLSVSVAAQKTTQMTDYRVSEED